MAKFMGKEIPRITMKLNDIVIIPDYHKHSCTGKGDYEFVSVTVVNGKSKWDRTLIRCKTCAKVFTPENILGRYVPIDNSKSPAKKQMEKVNKVLVNRIQLPRGSKIYCYRKNRHVCTGTPVYTQVDVALFKGKVLRKLFYCKTCKKYFYSGEMGKLLDYNSANGWFYDLYAQRGRIEPTEMTNNKENASSEFNPQMQKSPRNLRTIHPQDFLVVTSVKNCAVKGHNLTDIDARIRVLTDKGKIIQLITPAVYCSSCKQYYMLEQDYDRVLKYGKPICRIVTIESFIKMKEGKLQYNDESLLHSLGYNVNAQESLSDVERQRILSIVIDEGAMHKSEVLSFLDYLIRRSRGNPRLDTARGKWTRDRQYVSDYNRRKSKEVEIESITLKKYIRR